MFRKLILAMVATLAVGLATATFTSKTASAEVVENGWAPLTITLDNPCEAGTDPIVLTGSYHYLWYTTPEDTLIMRFNFHATGTDSGGTKYVLSGNRTMEHWAPPPVLAPYTDVIQRRLVSNGPKSNAWIEIAVEYSVVFPAPPALVVTEVTCHG